MQPWADGQKVVDEAGDSDGALTSAWHRLQGVAFPEAVILTEEEAASVISAAVEDHRAHAPSQSG